MGILNAFIDAANRKIAENLWPAYQQALMNYRAETLKGFIENQTNSIWKSLYLLALSQKDIHSAKNLYKKNKTSYNNGLNSLRAYRRFQPDVDLFMRKMADMASTYPY